MGTALIFDGNSILNRAFYGVRPLTSPEGLPTNALFGIVGMVNKAFAQIGVKPDYAAAAFDLKEKTFRHKACDTYKATRKPMPEDLARQLPYARELLAALGITVVDCAGYEADDILGTYARQCAENGDSAFLVTGDRDSFQLISDRVTVLLASNEDTKVMTPAAINEKYGVNPEQLIDVKAIMGDSSDNIAGVPGIGEKGALKLISQYGTLDGVYEHLAEITGSTNTKLAEGKESAYTSRFLAEINTRAPVAKTVFDCAYSGADTNSLRALYTKLGFKQFLDKLEAEAPEAEKEEYLPLSQAQPGGIVYACRDGGDFYACAGGKCFKGESSGAKALLAGADELVCWSVKEIFALADELGAALTGNIADVSLMAYVYSPADNGVSFGRSALDLLGVHCAGINISLLPQMYEKLCEKLTPEMQKLYREVELPLAKVLYGMEKRGFRVDRAALERFGEEITRSAETEEQEIYFLAGGEFNINSPKQLGNVLFEKLMLPHYRKTKSGYSTDAEVLERLLPYHPIVELILDYRKDSKLKSTYCDGLAKQITADGRIHTTFKQTQTLTGRLSSAEPNLQNIPVRGDKGRELRRFFVADEGSVLIDADYSQIELRVMAHVSGDETLINAFMNGEDIHTVTASQVFRVPANSVTPEMRKRAKAVNFGIIYGIGDYSLSQDLHISRRTAAEYIQSYLDHYPRVKEYLESAKANAKRDGFVTTMFGRRRNLPEINASNANVRAFGERVAMNTPIQGAAADLIKIAMIRTEKMLSEAGLKAKLILQIHDELIVEAPESEAEAASAILREAMTGAAQLSVPLVVDIGIGKSWFDAKN
ncbi:MAG: DNA polymerase I [Clostridia bacterium]|nr:DNA polymerase I [Clostridia bacterium]